MSILRLSAAALSALLPMGVLHAQTLYQNFQTLCVAPQANMKATLAVADAAGWQAPSAGEETPPTVAGTAFKTFAMRMRPVGKTGLVLGSAEAVSSAFSTASPTNVDMCFVGAMAADPKSLSDEKIALAGEPFKISGPSSMYFVDKANGRVSPLPILQAGDAFRAGKLGAVMLIDNPSATVLFYYVRHGRP